MKTKFYSIIFAAALSAVMVSCNKETKSSADSAVFKAEIEATRTTLDRTSLGGKVLWNATDEININGSVYTATPNASDASKADFALKEGQTEALSPFAAYYPASVFSGVKAILPSTQKYAGNVLTEVAPMYAYSEDENLLFHNVCGLLEIILHGDKTVKTVEVSAEEAMCGEFVVDENFNAVIKSGVEVNGVKLDCGEGVALTAEGVKFYVAVPVDQYHNLKFKVTTADGDVWEKTAGGVANVERNLIYTLDFTPSFPVVLAKWSWTALYSVNNGSENPKPELKAAAESWVGSSHSFNSDVVIGGTFKGISNTTEWSVGTATQVKDRLRFNKLSKEDCFQFEVPGVTAAAGSTIKLSGVCVATTNVSTGPCEWAEEYSVDGGTTWTKIKDIKLTAANVTANGNLDCEIVVPTALTDAKVIIRVRIASNNTASATFEDGKSNMAMIVINGDSNIATTSYAVRDRYYTDSWAYAVISLLRK